MQKAAATAGHEVGHLPVADDPDTLQVEAWPDPVLDRVGHDPRSPYVERYWLGILGPSTTWLLRHLAGRLEAEPEGFSLDLAETATQLGIGHRRGRQSPLARAFARCEQFGHARTVADGHLAVRRRMPALSVRQVAHLPARLQAAHRGLGAAAQGSEDVLARSRRLALSLVHLGEDPAAVTDQLRAWRFDPAIAAAATAWAVAQRLAGSTG